ncbi:MAG: hypothetical protein ACRD8O_17050 [Bryobacteraceae bacterium]
MSDAELLAIPEDAVPEADLARRSELLHSRSLDQLAFELNGTARPFMLFSDQDPRALRRNDQRRSDEEFEEAMRQVRERQVRLLAQIEHAQRENDERRRKIDDNAIRLRDGRRVYVDGDKYRDEQGRVLTGDDEAEAAREHENKPGASTWAEKQEAERQAEELRRQKERILRDRGEEGLSPEESARRLDGYERDFAQAVASRHKQVQDAPVDYGSANYMDEYQISSVPAFAQAAAVTRETIKQPTDTETESATAETKTATRPSGHSGPKLG